MLDACKKCRREGEKLMLKGERCLSPKCAVVRKPYAPGQHGQGSFKKTTEYGRQLREKQKAKRTYGIAETQFHNYAVSAAKMEGNTADNLLAIIESRIDNVVFRAGFAPSRSSARQLVSHGKYIVNSNKVTIPSILLKEGDVIAPKKFIKSDQKNNNLPTWFTLDSKKDEIKITHTPLKEETDTTINWNLIIEYYSR
jgi:small subunit ribosomal protein S4